MGRISEYHDMKPVPRSSLSRKDRKVVGATKHRSSDGTIAWYDENGKFHHDNDEPAVIFPNGQFQYWKHGKLHRDGGPAIMMEGVLIYFNMSYIHREDGPAVIHTGEDSYVEYWLNEKQYTKENWERKVSQLQNKSI